MNKHQYSHLSAQNLAFREYLELAKASSKDKIDPLKKKSKSPVHTEAHRKLEGCSEAQQYKMLEQRFRQLENKYRDLFEKAKLKNVEHQKLKNQIKTYQKYHQRDTEQIERLRCIIGLGLLKKTSVSIQVEEDQFDSENGRASRLNKFDQSTEDEIKLKHSGQKFNSKDKTSPFKNNFKKTETGFSEKVISNDCSLGGLYTKNKSKYNNLNNFDNNVSCSNLQYSNKQSNKVKLTNSPYSKLRFVPNASFK